MRFEKVFAKGRHHYLLRHRIRARVYYLFCKVYFHCDIPFETDIDKTAYFCYNAFGCVINPNSKICGKVVIQHSVTIGENNTHKAPLIKENVYIGARAVILGDIVIEENAKIGAGAVVLKNVPANCTVVGVPAHIVYKKEEIE